MKAILHGGIAWWLLAGCVDRGITPATTAMAADSADQVLERMTTTILADGVRRSVVYADTAYLYQERQVADLRNLTATFFDLQGNQTSVLTAKTGYYRILAGTLAGWGDVVVRATDGSGRVLRSQHLIFDRALNQIRSDSAFTYESPSGVVTGNSFYADTDFRNVVTRQPRGRQRGVGIPLPGQ
jgi:LPS export ABC transporter protein LptC